MSKNKRAPNPTKYTVLLPPETYKDYKQVNVATSLLKTLLIIAITALLSWFFVYMALISFDLFSAIALGSYLG